MTPADNDERAAPDAVVVLGPTASGKTRLGVHLALRFGGEVLSADSRQVYRGLDIGSGKDLDEYQVDGVRVPCHLIDIADVTGDEMSVFDYQRRFYAALADLRARGRLPVVVGGSGLYLEAVLRGYRLVEAPEDPALRAELAALDDGALQARLRAVRPALHNTTDLRDRERTVRAIEIAAAEARLRQEEDSAAAGELRPLVLGTRFAREVLRRRILQRLKQRLAGGLIEEVQRLLQEGVTRDKLHFLGLEYRYVAQYLVGEIRSRNDLTQKLHSAICAFAKRQESWFRRMERQGTRIHWLDGADLQQAEALLSRRLAAVGSEQGALDEGGP